METTLASQWDRVLARDASAPFVYSVRTTGIYCRPDCPSRRPNRENVAFWNDPAAAEAAGFRPCRRCKPNEASLEERQAAIVAAACATIASADDAPSLEELAAASGLSRFHFQRTFKRITGTTPKAYALAVRSDRVRRGLGAERSVTDAVYAAGFGSSTRFYDRARADLGMSPAAYRAGGRGELIRYTAVACSLGVAFIAATERGLCYVALGDDRNALEGDLRRRFRAASFEPADAAFDALARDVVDRIERPESARADVPLDIRGAAFQERVWRALRDIPLGQTNSYAEIARRIGAPSSARAVANACGSNPLAVVVPCHRAVGSDGALHGYRWGVERKKALLARERAT